MCMCILYMCTCVGRLSVFLYVCVLYSPPEERGRKKGEVGRGGEGLCGHGGVKGREYSFVQKYLPYKVWGANVSRGERVGLE